MKPEDFLTMVQADIRVHHHRLAGYWETLHGLVREARQHQRFTDRFLASDFNYFDLLPVDENRMSDLIAEFLSPGGSHGQGAKFLEYFVEALGFTEFAGRMQEVKVVREQPTFLGHTPERRIDIEIRFPNAAIGLENKIWSPDSRGQLSNYLHHFRSLYGKGYRVVYLSPHGGLPRNNSLNSEDRSDPCIRAVSYFGELRSWLLRCREKCEAERVRQFIACWVEYIERHLRPMEFQEEYGIHDGERSSDSASQE